MREFSKIALVGKSGSGKSMAFRNLNPKTCGFINLEEKPLPFINNFVHYTTPKSYQEAYQKLIEFGQNAEITEIVFESFSAYADDVLRVARETKRGFDVWNMYNDEISKFLRLIKRIPKDVIISAHYNIIQVDGGASTEKRIGVKGNEHNVVGIEKDFTIVVYTDVRVVDNKRLYQIRLLSDGLDTAKTPPYLIEKLEGEVIPNDIDLIVKAIRS